MSVRRDAEKTLGRTDPHRSTVNLGAVELDGLSCRSWSAEVNSGRAAAATIGSVVENDLLDWGN